MKLLARVLTVIYFKLFYRVEIAHAERVPQNGPALLCSNHNGMLDMFFLGYKLKRWIHWMAKEELFKNPVSGAIFRSLGAFPIKRGKGDVGSIKTAFKLFDQGHIVGIFPQGTRVGTDQRKTARIKPGAAMLAVNSGVPVIPVAVKGSYKPFSRIRVTYGEPFRLEAEEGKKYTGEELSELSRKIMDKIYALMEE